MLYLNISFEHSPAVHTKEEDNCPPKKKLSPLKFFESLSHKTFTDLNYDDLIINGLKIAKL